MEPVQPFDLQRMLIGEQPPLYLLEIFVRTVLLYAYAFLLLRLLGNRTVGQLSMIELLLVIALGSAVGDPMFSPDVPLLYGAIVIALVVGFDRLIDMMMTRSRRARHLFVGEPIPLVRDGAVLQDNLERAGLSDGDLLQQLRLKGVHDLAEVDQVYLETSGQMSVSHAKARRKKSRLPTFPPAPARTNRQPGAGVD